MEPAPPEEGTILERRPLRCVFSSKFFDHSFAFLRYIVCWRCVMKLESVVDREEQQPAAAAATTRYQEARLYLKPWYSPTNSYLQIDSPGGSTVECRSTLVLRVGYTTRAVPSTNHFTYTYQVSTWRWLAAWRSG